MKRTPKSLYILLAVLSAAGLLKATLPQIVIGNWTTTSNLSQARSNSASVLLPDGRILLIGGDGGSGALSSAELFGTDGAVTPAAAMNVARSRHFAVVMSDSRVLVGGGTTTGGATTNSAEIYDPTANSWTQINSLTSARANATAALLQDGRVLIAGGDNAGTPSNTIEIYDPSTGDFSFAGTLSSPRTQHAMAVLQDGRALIVGGTDGTNPLASSDIFDPSSGTNASAGPNLTSARYAASATTLLNGQVAVVGGAGTDTSGNKTDLASIEIFDPTAGSFSTASAVLTTAREAHQAFLLPNNNNVLITGGTSGGAALASVEMLTPQISTSNGAWTYAVSATGTMNSARAAATGAVNQANGPTSVVSPKPGYLIVGGGTDANGSTLATTEVYGYPTVQTDQGDYPPGTTVNITGSGFQPNETVTITLVESPLIDTHGPYTVTADANGNFTDSSFTTDLHDVNVRFWLSAAGNQSGASTQNTFTDANNPTLQVMVIGPSGSGTVSSTDGNINKCAAAPSPGATCTHTYSGNFNTTLTASTNTGFTFIGWAGGCTGTGACTASASGNQTFSATATFASNQAPAITSPNSTIFTVGSAGSFTVTATGVPVPALGESGTLPTGVNFNPTTGVLSGTPASGTGGTYPITFTASNGVSPNAIQNFTLTVNQAPAITSVNTTNFSVGTAGSFTVIATGFPAPTFSETGALPSGVTFTSAGLLSGTPAAGTGGSYPITVTASNGVSPNATQSFTLNVDQAPSITSVNNTTFKVGTAGSFTTTSSGFPTSTFTEAGSLPSGVTFTSAGVLSGTPAAGTGGTYPITITASNGISPNAPQAFTLTVDQAPAITSGNSAGFVINQAGSFTVTATGFPSPTLSETGTLPNGVTFTSTGVLSGTPTQTGIFNLTISASNGVSPNATQSFTLTVGQAPSFTSANNTSFTVGTAGSFTVAATGFPAPTFSESGVLPSGVTLSSAGVLSGTPASGTVGTYPITITASNGVSPNATQTFTLTVSKASASFNVPMTAPAPVPYGTAMVSLPPNTTIMVNELGGKAVSPDTVTITVQGLTGVVAQFNGNSGTFGPVNINVSTLSPGTYTISYQYSGNANVNGFTDASTSLVVTQANTTTTLTSSSNPSTSGQSVTFTATVADSSTGSSGTPTGSVTFQDGATTLALNVPVSTTAGVTKVTFTTSALAAGSHSLKATYSGDTNFTSSSGTLTQNVLSPPSISKAFGAATVPLNGTTTLTFTVTNPGANPLALTGLAFTDTLPSGLVVATPPNASNTCGGTVTAAASSTSVSLSNGSITTPGASCTIAVSVTGTTAGQKNNITGAVTSTNGGNGNTASASITVDAPPTISKAFGANQINLNTTTSLTITISNSNGNNLTGLAFTDPLPVGLVVATPSGLNNSCGGTATAAAGSSSVTLSGGTVNANNSCTVALNVTATSTGLKSNTIASVASNEGGSGTASNTAAVNVVGTPPTITSANNTTFVAGIASSFTVMTTGIPTASLTESGALPASVTFSDNGNGTATISYNGTAITAGNYPIVVKATNGVPPDASQNFTLSVIAGSPASIIVFSGSGQSTTVGMAFANPLVAKVQDAFNNPVGGASVVFAAPASGGSGTFVGGSTVTTDTNGLAGASFAANTAAGSYAVTASVSGVTMPASFSLMNLPGMTTTLAINPPTATIIAGDSENYTAEGLDQYNNVTGDLTASTKFTISPDGSCSPVGADPVSCTTNIADTNGSGHIITGLYTNGAAGVSVLTVTPGAFTQLQLLVPGETAAPGTATGKTGTPNTEYVNGSFNVIVNATDQFFNVVNSVTDTVHITSNDGKAMLPSDSPLVNGTGGFSVTLETVSYNPSTTTITASDVTDPTKTSDTSSAIQVIVVYTATITPTMTGTGDATAYTLTVNNAISPNTNNLESVQISVPSADQNAISGVSVTSSNGGPLTWNYDTSKLPGILRFFANSDSDAVAPGGTIKIAFTATSNAVVNTDPISEYWTTVAFSDKASNSSLPLAGPEPTVQVGAAPQITSGNTATFTYETPGTMFTVTITGVPTPILRESGSLPPGLTFTPTAGGATISGTPTSAGSYPISVTASSGFGPDATQTLTVVVNKADSVSTVMSSAEPSVFGQSVTFTATVSAAALSTGTPTGTVMFKDGNATLGTGTLNGSGQATFSTSSLSVTSHSITAVYSGDANFHATNEDTGSTAISFTQIVNAADTSSTVASSVNPSVFGQSVTFTATVGAVAPGSGTPGGTVQFVVDGVNFGSPVVLVAGSATSNATSTLNVSGSPHTVTANYVNTDGNFKNSTGSLAGGQNVTAASTSTAVSSSQNPSVYGQAVTFSATVSVASPGVGPATGSVQFVVDGVNFGLPVPLTSGSAIGAAVSTLTVSGTPHSISANYVNSDGNFKNSAGVLSGGQVVSPAPLAITATSGAFVYGAVPSVVTPSYAGFVNGDTATSLTTQPTCGPVFTSVTAVRSYPTSCWGASDPNYTITYNTGLVTVTPATSAFSNLTAPQTMPFGTGTIALSGTILASCGMSCTIYPPTGEQVTITINATPVNATIGTNGAFSTTFDTHAITASTTPYPITYTYNNPVTDNNFTSATDSSTTLTVNPATTSVSVTSSENPSIFGDSVTFTATIADTSTGDTAVPTNGTVQFVIDGMNSGAPVPMTNGTATSMAVSTLIAGQHVITAAFSGDTDFTGSTSPFFVETVNNPLASIAVTPANSTIVVGQSEQFASTGTFKDGTSSILPPGGTWAMGPPMTNPVSAPMGATGPNGIYFFGGQDAGGAENFVQSYNPATGAWAAASKSGFTARYAGVAVAPGDGKIYVIGGLTGSGTSATNIVEAYDPVANAWSSKAAMPSAGGCLVGGAINGQIYVLSGCASTSSYINRLDVYNPSSNSWNASPLAAPASGHASGAAGVINAQFYVAGGYDTTGAVTGTTESFDPQSNTWTNRTAMPTPLAQLAGAVINQRLYATGGVDASNNEQDTIYVYDPSQEGSGPWTPLSASLSAASTNTGSVSLDGLLFAGGGNGNVTLGTLAFVDTDNVTWSSGNTTVATIVANSGSATGANAGGPVNISASSTTYAVTGSTPLTVAKADTKTQISSGATPSSYGQAVTFVSTVTVNAPGAGTPTGTVTFEDGGTPLAGSSTVSLSNGMATFTTAATQFAAGNHTITAVYNGDANFNATNSDVGSVGNAFSQIVNQALPAFNSLSSATITYGTNSVTLTGTIAATCGTAGCSTVYPSSGETINVTIGSTSGSGTITGNGAFSVTVTGTTALMVSSSPYPICYKYAGDTNFNGATDKTTTLTVQKATPTFSNLSGSQMTPYGTGTITVSGNLSALTATPPNADSVTVSINGTSVSATVGLNNGMFTTTLNTSTIPASATPYTINYSFAGDSNFNPTNDASTTLTITKATPTFSNLTILPTIVYGTPTISLSGKLTAPTATPPNADSMTVSINGTASAPIALNNGMFTATLNTSTIPASATPYTITYSFAGDSNFNSASDISTSLAVNPANTTTTASSVGAVYGQPTTVMFNASVTANAPSTATVNQGSATFTVNGSLTVGGAVSNGAASAMFSTLGISAGSYPLVASYSGGNNFNPSMSTNSATLTVTAAPTNTTVTSSTGGTSIYLEPVTFTATISAPGGYLVTPVGTVIFYDAASGANCNTPVNGTQIGTPQTLINGSASVTTATLTGALASSGGQGHNILACYADTTEVIPNFYSSSGNATQTVDAVPVITITPASNAFSGQAVGTTSSPFSFTIGNIGDATLYFGSPSINGDGTGTSAPSEFSIYTKGSPTPAFCGSTLAAGATCTIQVTFAPTETGEASAILELSNNNDQITSIASQTQNITLTGGGLSTLTSGGSLYNYAIFATQGSCGSITMNGNAIVDSFNSAVAGGYSTSHLLSGGNVGTNGNVSLTGNATIYGSAALDYANAGTCSKSSLTGITTSGKAKVTNGNVALNGPINLPAPVMPNPAPPTNTQSISGSCGSIAGCASNGSKSVSLAPGQYGNLSVNGGTVAHVRTGTYNFNSLTLTGNSTLYVDSGPVIINLAGASLTASGPALDLSGGSIVNPSGKPSNLEFFYGGSHAMNLSGGSQAYATVYAPNAPVNMSGGTDFFGAIIGSTVTNSGGTAVHFDTNLTNIAAGQYLWFNVVANNIQYKGAALASSVGQVKLYLTNSTINFTANGTSYTFPVPNAVLTLNSASVTSPTTAYGLTNTRWATSIPPSQLTGNTFVTGIAIPVPGGSPSGIQNVTWSSAFSTDTPNITLQWQWSAGLYAAFNSCYAFQNTNSTAACYSSVSNSNVLSVNPEDGSADTNGTDPAGTPETYKSAEIIGLFSPAAGVTPAAAEMSASPSNFAFATPTHGGSSTSLVSVITNNDGVTHNFVTPAGQTSPIYVAGSTDFVVQSGAQPGDSAMIPNCVGLTSLSAGSSCNLHVVFTPTIIGAESAKIVVSDDANNNPQTVYLTGSGQ